MENKQQTAIKELIDICNKDQVSFTEWFLENQNKYLMIEKEQIINAYGQGVADEAGEILDVTKDSEQYYNETYGKHT